MEVWASHHVKAVAGEEGDDGLVRLQRGAAADVAIALPWAVRGLREQLRHPGRGRHTRAVGRRGILAAEAGMRICPSVLLRDMAQGFQETSLPRHVTAYEFC